MRLLRPLTGSAVAAAALTAAAVLSAPAGSAVTPTSARAAERVRPVIVTSPAQKLAAQLGSAGAGVYLDSAGRTHAAVTTPAAAARARAAGAIPTLVRRSQADLYRAQAALDASARVPGTAWSVDPAANQVVVQIDQSVRGAARAKVAAAVAKLGSAARLERVSGTFSTRISGGEAIYGSSYRCSLGFNVWNGRSIYFLTAGHCGNLAATWYADSRHTSTLGTRVASSFPDNDYAIIVYNTGVVHPGVVNLYNGSTQDITTAGTPTVGQTVYRSGSTTGLRSGRVTALNATVTYPEGTVSGLIRTTVCAEGGDSGGALFSGVTAYGLTSGGNGNCTTGGTTYFQPVAEPLIAYGVAVY